MEETEIEFTKEYVEEMLGSPTDISSLEKEGQSLSELAFNLYREAVIITILTSHVYESTYSANSFLLRNQAVEVGLAVRIAKYMGAVLALLVDKVREHGEVIMTLNRCITESAVNLEFFCRKASSEDYDEFVLSSLKPEINQRKTILENIVRRGEEIPIETRMLRSIERTFKVSGVEDIDALMKIPKRKTYDKILEALDMVHVYPMLQGVPSHAVHGTWVDLVLHHLEETKSGFKPRPETRRADARQLLPVGLFVLYAMRTYISSRFPRSHPGIVTLLSRTEDLIQRISTVDSVHEKKLSVRKDPRAFTDRSTNS